MKDITKIKCAYYIRRYWEETQCYSTLGRAIEGAKFRGGDIYGVAIIKGKPRIVARFVGWHALELNDYEKRLVICQKIYRH